jgi:hypothetical protein
MADNEDELVSDYFLSYGQAYNDHCLYDMESSVIGNEMRFLNSAHNMNTPPNVRIEGRVIDILFVNLPCVIATRAIKVLMRCFCFVFANGKDDQAGEELLLDYIVEGNDE